VAAVRMSQRRFEWHRNGGRPNIDDLHGICFDAITIARGTMLNDTAERDRMHG
jgi:hypothetical protein